MQRVAAGLRGPPVGCSGCHIESTVALGNWFYVVRKEPMSELKMLLNTSVSSRMGLI